MNFVADENIDIEIIDHLRNASYEIFSINSHADDFDERFTVISKKKIRIKRME